MNSQTSQTEDDYNPLLPVFLILLGLGVLYIFFDAKKRPARLSFRQLQRNVAAGHRRAAAAVRAADGTFLPDSLLKAILRQLTPSPWSPSEPRPVDARLPRQHILRCCEQRSHLV